MKNLFARFVREEEGQDLIEYALLAALIAVACFLIIQTVGSQVNTVFGQVSTQLTDAGS